MAKKTSKNSNASQRFQGEWAPLFLVELRNSGNVRQSCEKAGVGRKTVYEHRDRDPEFAAAWADAVEDACDELEKIARQRATTVSDTLLIFLLKAHRPERYRERYDHQHSGKGGGPVVLQIVEEVVHLPDKT